MSSNDEKIDTLLEASFRNEEKLKGLLNISEKTANTVLSLDTRLIRVETKFEAIPTTTEMYRSINTSEDNVLQQLRNHSKDPKAHIETTTNIKTELAERMETTEDKKWNQRTKLIIGIVSAIMSGVAAIVYMIY